jgi:exonuclease V gamma subunit
VTDRWTSGVVTYQFSRVSKKQMLELWVRHLALCCELPEHESAVSTLIGREPTKVEKLLNKDKKKKKDKDGTEVVTFGRVPDARRHLAALARLYDLGMRAPLAFAPESSGDYASHFRESADPDAALAEACKTYGSGNAKGERGMNEYLLRLFDEDSPPFARSFHLGPDFATLARAVYDPLQSAIVSSERKEKR